MQADYESQKKRIEIELIDSKIAGLEAEIAGLHSRKKAIELDLSHGIFEDTQSEQSRRTQQENPSLESPNTQLTPTRGRDANRIRHLLVEHYFKAEKSADIRHRLPEIEIRAGRFLSKLEKDERRKFHGQYANVASAMKSKSGLLHHLVREQTGIIIEGAVVVKDHILSPKSGIGGNLICVYKLKYPEL